MEAIRADISSREKNLNLHKLSVVNSIEVALPIFWPSARENGDAAIVPCACLAAGYPPYLFTRNVFKGYSSLD